jgi:uncharacterized protein YndB with AHSA1/START domain
MMATATITHADFTLERTYPYPPARVFRAFADPTAKSMWFGGAGDGMKTEQTEFDFRVGGQERLVTYIDDGPAFGFDARFEDIVENERIVTTYSMTVDGRRMSVSVSATEFLAADGGTRLVVTEQGTFLDGLDTNAQREHGTGELLDALGRALADGAGDG